MDENNKMKNDLENINKIYSELEGNFNILKIENENLKMLEEQSKNGKNE